MSEHEVSRAVTDEQLEVYFNARRDGLTKLKAAGVAGIEAHRVYGELMKDERFRVRDQECFDESWEPEEGRMLRIARGDERCTDQSLRALMFGLKARRKWQDRVQVDVRSTGYEPYMPLEGEDPEKVGLPVAQGGLLRVVEGGDESGSGA